MEATHLVERQVQHTCVYVISVSPVPQRPALQPRALPARLHLALLILVAQARTRCALAMPGQAIFNACAQLDT